MLLQTRDQWSGTVPEEVFKDPHAAAAKDPSYPPVEPPPTQKEGLSLATCRRRSFSYPCLIFCEQKKYGIIGFTALCVAGREDARTP